MFLLDAPRDKLVLCQYHSPWYHSFDFVIEPKTFQAYCFEYVESHKPLKCHSYLNPKVIQSTFKICVLSSKFLSPMIFPPPPPHPTPPPGPFLILFYYLTFVFQNFNYNALIGKKKDNKSTIELDTLNSGIMSFKQRSLKFWNCSSRRCLFFVLGLQQWFFPFLLNGSFRVGIEYGSAAKIDAG